MTSGESLYMVVKNINEFDNLKANIYIKCTANNHYRYVLTVKIGITVVLKCLSNLKSMI